MKAALLVFAAVAAAPPVVQDREFIVTDTATGELSRTSRSVPNRPGTACYEWAITVAPEERLIEIVETMILPAPAAQWNVDGDQATTVAPDRAGATTRLVDDLSDGRIEHGWCVAAGDPLGTYRIDVTAEGAKLGSFTFVLVPDRDTV